MGRNDKRNGIIVSEINCDKVKDELIQMIRSLRTGEMLTIEIEMIGEDGYGKEMSKDETEAG